MPVSPAQMNPATRLVQGPGKVLHEENSRTALTMVTTTKEARKVPQFRAAFTATLGALCAGTFFSWSSAVKPLIAPVDTQVKGAIGKETFSWISSILMFGAFAGCLLAGMAANRFGRRRSLLFLSLPMLAAWLLLSVPSSIACLLLGRVLGGMAIGALSVVGCMYVSEVAEPSVRGTLGSFFQLQITVGILIGMVAGLLHDAVHLAYFNLALPVVFAALFWPMPESPVFLLSRGQSERARDALQWLRGPHYDVSEEMASIRHSIMESSQTKASVRDLVRSPVAAKGMVVALGLMAAQQLSGINAVIFYTGPIFESTGSKIKGDVSAIIVGVVQVLSTFMSTVLADRAGRRLLLLLSSGVMTICLCTLGVYFRLSESGHDMQITWLPLVVMAVLIVVFSLGLGPLPWCVVNEIFSPNVKGAASSVACAANWLMAFVVTKFFSNLENVIHQSGAFFVFTVIAALGTVFIALMVPETKGKTLDEILAKMTGTKGCTATDDGIPASIEEEEEEEDTSRKPFPL